MTLAGRISPPVYFYTNRAHSLPDPSAVLLCLCVYAYAPAFNLSENPPELILPVGSYDAEASFNVRTLQH